jgi:HTH-type transcriptional regulator / antitoxin HipB
MALQGKVTNPEDLGRMLQQGRLLSGLTQRQLAAQLGLSQRYVWELESGKPSLVMTRLFDVMRATGVRLTAEVDDRADDPGARESL